MGSDLMMWLLTAALYSRITPSPSVYVDQHHEHPVDHQCAAWYFVFDEQETTPKNAKSDMHGPSASAAGWGTNAFELMKDRATIAKNHLAPQIVSMREKTSKR